MIICRFGEIFLKSKPVKKRFLDQLTSNINLILESNKEKMKRKRLRIWVYPENEEKALEDLKRTFGLVTVSKATETEPDLEEIEEIARKKTEEWKGTYAVRAQRITKQYPFTSKEAEEKIGAAIGKNRELEVDLDNPENTLYIEFYDDKAHVFTEKQKAPGGLPLGVSSTLKAKLNSKKDLIAAWMMMKRGCLIKPIENQETPEKVKKNFEKWHKSTKKPTEPQGTVTGSDKLQQIKKQRKKNLKPIYTPLIGLDQQEIQELEEKIFKG